MQYLPLVISVLAALFATLQLLLQARMAREMERTKLALTTEQSRRGEHLRKYLEAFVQGQEKQLNAFREILQHGQSIRDTVRGATETPRALDASAAVADLHATAREILAAYARNQTFFEEEDRKLAHRYKNLCAHSAEALATMLRDDWPTNLDAEQMQRMNAELAHAHERLRNAAVAAVNEYILRLRSEVASGDEQ